MKEHTTQVVNRKLLKQVGACKMSRLWLDKKTFVVSTDPDENLELAMRICQYKNWDTLQAWCRWLLSQTWLRTSVTVMPHPILVSTFYQIDRAAMMDPLYVTQLLAAVAEGIEKWKARK